MYFLFNEGYSATAGDDPLRVDLADPAYRRVGVGPDVLFVHGWPVSSATFRTLLPHLVDQVTCHLVDLPGAGSSRFDATTHLSVEQHIRTVRGTPGYWTSRTSPWSVTTAADSSLAMHWR